MEISDYSQRLAQQRDTNNNALKQIKDGYSDDLKAGEERHQMTQAKQKESYEKSLAKLDDNQKDYIGKSSEETKRILKEKQEAYKSGIENLRSDFAQKRKDMQTSSNSKLSTLKEAFDKSAESMNDYESNKANYLRDKFQSHTGQRAEEHANEMKGLNRLVDKKFQETNERNNFEKREMINDHAEESRNLAKSGSEKMGQQRRIYDDTVERLRKSHDGELRETEDHYNSRVGSLQAMQGDNIDSLENRFGTVGDRMKEKMIFEKRKLAEKSARNAEVLQDKFNKDVYDLKRKSDRLVDTGGVVDEKDRAIEKLKNNQENRIGSLRNQMDELRFMGSVEQEKATASHQKALRDKVYTLNSNVERKDREHAEQTQGMYERFGTERDLMTDANRKRLQQNDQENASRLVTDRMSNRKIMDNQKKEYSKVVSSLNNKNMEAVQNLQDEFKKEKSNFFETTKKDFHNQSEEIKDFYKNRITDTTDSYQMKLESEQKEKFDLTAGYESRLSNLKKSATDVLREEKLINDQRRMDDKRGHQHELESKEREWHQRFLAMKSNFDANLSETKHMNDIQITKFTKRHQEEMDRMRSEMGREQQMKLSEAQEQYMRLAENSEIRLEALRNQYEMKMEKLRLAHQSKEAKGMA